jgi:hypothetical protein
VGTFDAALFSDVNRWLEVTVDNEVLTPRQIIGSVPWALIAERVAPWDPNTTPRFEDCGDGTVADHQTGLQWEKKTGTWVIPGVYCDTVPCPDPHDVNNRYTWSLGAPWNPDGGAFTDFLAKLNDLPPATPDPTECFANNCDWRLPTVAELRTIMIGTDAAPGQATTCSAIERPCIDPDFAAVGGNTYSLAYWSASTDAGNPDDAWLANFYNGGVGIQFKEMGYPIHAVRAGSCN